VLVVLLVGFGVFLLHQGIDDADHWASIVGVFLNVVALGVGVCGVWLARHRTPPPSPRQLPADVSLFVGRDAQLKLLTRHLRPVWGRRRSTVPLLVLSGTAGVGKSALAIRWAHRAARSYPDGQLYLDLGGFGPGAPVEPADALSSLLHGLGVTPSGPPCTGRNSPAAGSWWCSTTRRPPIRFVRCCRAAVAPRRW